MSSGSSLWRLPTSSSIPPDVEVIDLTSSPVSPLIEDRKDLDIAIPPTLRFPKAADTATPSVSQSPRAANTAIPPILRLPTELLLEIAKIVQDRQNYRSSPNLFNFRLTCTDFAQVGLEVFLFVDSNRTGSRMYPRFRLQSIVYDLTERSLQIMHAVMRNPALCKQIFRLEVAFRTRDYQEIINTLATYNQNGADHDRELLMTKLQDRIMGITQMLLVNMFTQDHLGQLTEIFKLAKDSILDVEIRLDCLPTRDFQCSAPNEFVEALKPRWIGALNLLRALPAPETSDCIFYCDLSNIDARLWSVQRYYPSGSPNVLEMVTMLSVGFDLPTIVAMKQQDMEPDNGCGWHSVLSRAKHLEILALSFGIRPLTGECHLKCALFARFLLASQHWQKLISLCLDAVSMYLIDFRDVLLTHSATPRCLRTSSDTVILDGHWKDMLATIKSSVTLTYADIGMQAEAKQDPEFETFCRTHKLSENNAGPYVLQEEPNL